MASLSSHMSDYKTPVEYFKESIKSELEGKSEQEIAAYVGHKWRKELTMEQRQVFNDMAKNPPKEEDPPPKEEEPKPSEPKPTSIPTATPTEKPATNIKPTNLNKASPWGFSSNAQGFGSNAQPTGFGIKTNIGNTNFSIPAISSGGQAPPSGIGGFKLPQAMTTVKEEPKGEKDNKPKTGMDLFKETIGELLKDKSQDEAITILGKEWMKLTPEKRNEFIKKAEDLKSEVEKETKPTLTPVGNSKFQIQQTATKPAENELNFGMPAKSEVKQFGAFSKIGTMSTKPAQKVGAFGAPKINLNDQSSAKLPAKEIGMNANKSIWAKKQAEKENIDDSKDTDEKETKGPLPQSTLPNAPALNSAIKQNNGSPGKPQQVQSIFSPKTHPSDSTISQNQALPANPQPAQSSSTLSNDQSSDSTTIQNQKLPANPQPIPSSSIIPKPPSSDSAINRNQTSQPSNNPSQNSQAPNNHIYTQIPNCTALPAYSGNIYQHYPYCTTPPAFNNNIYTQYPNTTHQLPQANYINAQNPNQPISYGQSNFQSSSLESTIRSTLPELNDQQIYKLVAAISSQQLMEKSQLAATVFVPVQPILYPPVFMPTCPGLQGNQMYGPSQSPCLKRKKKANKK